MSDQWSQPASTWPSNSGEAVVEVVAAPEVQLTVQEKNGYIKSWLGLKEAASAHVEAERAARELVTTALFPTPKKGTQRYVSPEGFGSIKLVYGWNFTLGDSEKVGNDGQKVPKAAQVDAVLEKIEDLGERGKLIADRIVKWTPELSVTEYEMLAASEEPLDIAAKTLIDEILTVKPKTPALEFEPPKAKS